MQTEAPFEIRRARPGEYGEVARLHRCVMKACLPYLPDLHTPEEDLRFFRHSVFGHAEVWVAVSDTRLIGYCVFRPGWIDHLYVLPAHHGRGIGTALLEKAKGANSSLELWTFQRNERARSFYETHGFTLVETTDGSGNEEREPDARYRWAR